MSNIRRNTVGFPLVLLLILLLFSHCRKEYSGVGLPEVVTLAVSGITTCSIVSGGEIQSENGFPVSAYGLLMSEFDDFRKQDSVVCGMLNGGRFNADIAPLKYKQTLYLRAWATNAMGTGYGEVIEYTHQKSGLWFNPDLTYGTMHDIEGNAYRTIMIGTQEWMAENLKVTKYNDGTPIPHAPANDDWKILSFPAWCWYQNSEADYRITYGAMYNWWAATSGKICPTGWHVPDSVEFTILIQYLGGSSAAGNKLKEKGSSHWIVTNEGTNESGFTGVPGGYRDNTGMFYYNGHYGHHWSTTGHYWKTTKAHMVTLRSYDASASIGPFTEKKAGLSIRCLRD